MTTRYRLYRGLSADRAIDMIKNTGTPADSSYLHFAPVEWPAEIVRELVNVCGSRA